MNDKQAKFFNKETIVYFIALIVSLVWSITTVFLLGRALKLVGADVNLTSVLSVYSTITAVFMTVLNFYFGSTKGSQERTAQMMEMAKALPISPSPTPSVAEAFKALQEKAKNAGVTGWETMTEDQLKQALGDKA